MLVRLCSVPAATEELARKDDLTLLFSALSSWCPQHNLLWRKNANEVLVVLTRHGLTSLVLGYIHSTSWRDDVIQFVELLINLFIAF